MSGTPRQAHVIHIKPREPEWGGVEEQFPGLAIKFSQTNISSSAFKKSLCQEFEISNVRGHLL